MASKYPCSFKFQSNCLLDVLGFTVYFLINLWYCTESHQYKFIQHFEILVYFIIAKQYEHNFKLLVTIIWKCVGNVGNVGEVQGFRLVHLNFCFIVIASLTIVKWKINNNYRVRNLIPLNSAQFKNKNIEQIFIFPFTWFSQISSLITVVLL